MRLEVPQDQNTAILDNAQSKRPKLLRSMTAPAAPRTTIKVSTRVTTGSVSSEVSQHRVKQLVQLHILAIVVGS